jgi:hypothetical protein
MRFVESFLLAQGTKPIDPTSWIMIALGATLLIYMSFRPMLRKRKDPLEKHPFSSLATQRAVEREMQNVLVQLSDMARQMSAQLDTRAARLEELLRQADERIATLRRISNDLPDLPPRQESPREEPPSQVPFMRLTEDTTPRMPVGDPNPDPRHLEIYSLSDQGLSARDIAIRLDRPAGEIDLILALRGRS